LQLELKELDVNLHTMMLQNVPSIDLNRRLLQNQINSRRVAQILDEASQPDLDLLPTRNRSEPTTDQLLLTRYIRSYDQPLRRESNHIKYDFNNG